jgi:flagellar biosynthesis protein FlhB
MNQEEQIQKILELETEIRAKQTSKFSAHTLMPVGLVLTIVGFSFAIGMNFQAANQTKIDLENFKKEYKDGQVELKKEFTAGQQELKSDIKSISTQVQDIRILILSNPNFISK